MTKKIINGAMVRSTPWVDRFSIGVSILCFVHCLSIPIILTLLPNLTGSFIATEEFHAWLVYIVIPASILALGLGCKQHKRISTLALGLSGLGLLIAAINVHSSGLDHHWEQRLTVLGTLLIAFAHIRNFKLCKDSQNCECELN